MVCRLNRQACESLKCLGLIKSTWLMFTPDQTLQALLHRTVEQAVRYGKTLVLVTPRELRLQPAFFVSLGHAWQQANASHTDAGIESTQTGMSIPRLRVDWCSDDSTTMSLTGWLDRLHTRKCERWLRRERLSECVQLSRCLLIGKASQQTSTVVMGIAPEGRPLPAWGTAVPMQC